MPASDLQTDTASAEVHPTVLTFASAAATPLPPELTQIIRLLAGQAAREYYEGQRKGPLGPGS